MTAAFRFPLIVLVGGARIVWSSTAVAAALAVAAVLAATPGGGGTPTPTPTSSPTATATPTGTAAPSACPAWPAFPTPACTGWAHTGVTLTAYTGSTTISASGTTISGKDISGCLTVTGSNVTIENSRIRCQSGSPTAGGAIGIDFRSGSNLVVRDTEITRANGNGLDYAIRVASSGGTTITRAYMHDLTSCIHVGAGHADIEDSNCEDLVNISGEDHNDAIISNGGATSVQLIHNNLENQIEQTASIAMYPEPLFGGANSYWTIHNNRLTGGNFCLRGNYTPGPEQPNNHITFTDNLFSQEHFPKCGEFGYTNGGMAAGAGNVWSGNKNDAGTTIPIDG